MKPNRWITPALPATIIAVLGFAAAAVSAHAQAAPTPSPTDVQKYDRNGNGVLDPDELAQWQADRATPTASAGAGATTDSGNEVIQLSPFQVDATKDKGYFAENTLAGSRMNTNIADLGASISVVTKQQIEDTASVDINDVFRYEINTEGSGTYTPSIASMRNDGVLDVNAGGTLGSSVSSFTNATANRVRGLGVPSSAINYYPSIGQIPMDAYNVQSLEISRGPNSMLFGMGSPAGIVNQSTSQAALNKNTNSAQVRFDQYGSYRGSLAINRSLIDRKLAIFAAVMFDKRQFERKPSYDITRRQYGAITFKPFEKTTIRANVEGYNNDNRRPNTLTPRDYITQWDLAGRPTYDPLTKKITKLGTGEVIGPYIVSASSPYANDVINYVKSRKDFDPTKWNATANTYNGVSIFGEAALTNTNSILFVPGITWTNQARTQMQIVNGQLVNWFQPLGSQTYRNAWGTATNPTANATPIPSTATVYASPTLSDIYNRYYTSSTGWSNLPNQSTLGGYKYPGVTDRSVYDWKKININQMNFGKERNQNYNVELEQEITRDLFFNAGWFRQDFDSFSNYTVAQLNVATLYVDTTKYLPDGRPNPFFGLPYVEDQDPDRYVNAETDDHFRGMLAYTPDFRRSAGWLKWLGHHQILGLWSRDEYMASSYRQRLEYVDSATQAGKYRYMANQNNNADGTPSGWNFQTTSLRRTFYLANPGDAMGRVTRSSGEWNPLTYNGDIRVFNYETGQFENVNMTTTFNNFDAGTARNQRTIQSYSAGMTNYFWDDRVVTTFGARKDLYKARTTTNDKITLPDGTVIPAMTNAQKWVNGYYDVDQILNRWNTWDRLTGYTSTLGAVVRPFKSWGPIENRASAGNQFWQFVRDFGLSINRSDNFNAPAQAQVDPLGRPLPKPTGDGKDYGFQFSMFDGKLFARVTWFEASNENERIAAGTPISRMTDNMDQTLFRNWARTIAMINMGMDPTQTGFGDNLSSTVEQQVQDAAAKIWQQPYTYYGSLGNIGATRNAKAKGVEAQVNYNPTRNWTMKFTFGKQDTVYTSVLKEFDLLYNKRVPIWQSAKAKDYLLPQYQNLATYTTAAGRPVDLTTFWQSYGFNTAVTQGDSFGNTNVENYYNINVLPQVALARDLEGQSAPGQRKYRWNYLTNYTFDSGKLKGWGVGGSERWEDRAIIGYYGKASHAIAATPNLIDISDTTRPIYDKANWYTDVWVSYQRRILEDRVRMKLQLNVVNAFENGGLRAVAVNYDGSPYAFRIVDPRQFILSASFEF